MKDFLEVVRERRSANKFVEGIKIPQKDFDEIFQELSLAPSAFNLQHANYYVVEEKELVERLHDAAFSQYKIKTASATIIVTGDKKAYPKADKIYEGSKMLGILDNTEYKHVLGMINNLYEGWGDTFQHDEAIRNASLSSMLFMLLAKDKGWDTCPMIYFDKEKMKDILEIPKNEEPVLMITIGKMDVNSNKLRGYRKSSTEFVKYFEA